MKKILEKVSIEIRDIPKEILMLRYIMKKILLVFLISIFAYSPGFAFTKGKGEVKMTEKALNHFVNYVWGNFDVDLTKVQAWSSRANNPKPLMFIMSSNGDWTTAWFCPYSRCSDPDSKQTIKECERETGTTCGVFALRKRIYWDNGINTKTNKAKVNKNMDYERIKSLMISLGFYE